MRFILICCCVFLGYVAVLAQASQPAATDGDSLPAQISIAQQYGDKANWALAAEWYGKALSLAQKQGDSAQRNLLLLRLGEAYYAQKKWDVAENYWQNALQLAQQRGDTYTEAIALAQLSQVYAARKEIEKSLAYNAQSLAKGKEFYDVQRTNYDQMATVYANAGKFKEAYEYRQKYIAVKDSLLRADKAKSLRDLQMQYKIADKQKEIELLTKENSIKALQARQSQLVAVVALLAFICLLVAAAVLLNQFISKRRSNTQLEEANAQIRQTIAELEQANTQIQQTVAEKETLLKEIHHRVKNNLQLVSSLLDWQTEGIDDPQVRRLIDEGRSRIRSMALMHEYLYKSENLANVDVHKYLGELADTLTRSYRPHTNIVLQKNIAHAYFDTDTVVPLGLIVNELLSNAFKYAFVGRAAGQVDMTLLRSDNDSFVLSVSDNGIGLPADFENTQHQSLGIQLVKTLVKQMKATLQYGNRAGAFFDIQFKAKK